MSEPLLKIENLSAGYEKKPVLSGVSFAADRGKQWSSSGRTGRENPLCF